MHPRTVQVFLSSAAPGNWRVCTAIVRGIAGDGVVIQRHRGLGPGEDTAATDTRGVVCDAAPSARDKRDGACFSVDAPAHDCCLVAINGAACEREGPLIGIDPRTGARPVVPNLGAISGGDVDGATSVIDATALFISVVVAYGAVLKSQTTVATDAAAPFVRS